MSAKSNFEALTLDKCACAIQFFLKLAIIDSFEIAHILNLLTCGGRLGFSALFVVEFTISGLTIQLYTFIWTKNFTEKKLAPSISNHLSRILF